MSKLTLDVISNDPLIANLRYDGDLFMSVDETYDELLVYTRDRDDPAYRAKLSWLFGTEPAGGA